MANPYARPRGRSGPDLRRLLPQPWTPWTPDPVPTGLYDPSLDAQLGQINRGFEDTLGDAAIATTRRGEDHAHERGQIQQGHAWSREDLDRSIGRTREDIGTSRTRGKEDYDRSVQMLQRSFRQLGNRQAQQARAYGVQRGGAALQAARKRAENEALERQPLDTNFTRFNADLDRSGSRAEQDYLTAFNRNDTNAMNALTRLDTMNTRAGQDTDLGVWRADRETVNAGLDIGDLKRYQAVGAGWQPSEAPSNEFVGPQGPYRVLQRGNFNVRVNPAGYTIGRTRRRR